MFVYARLYLWLPALLWCGFIYFLSSLPDLSSGLQYDFFLRKIAHAFEYAILALLAWRAVRGTTQCSYAVAASIVFAFCALYAVSDEFHQSFVPGRKGSVYDVGVDIVGAFVGLLAIGIKKQF